MKQERPHDQIEGFYAAYLTGASGPGVALFMFRKGKIIGSDGFGAHFVGEYRLADPGKGYSLKLGVRIPANVQLIQGGNTGSKGDSYELTCELDPDFLSKEFIRVEDKYGPVNVKIEKVNDLDE
jgi:hypothetical protein